MRKYSNMNGVNGNNQLVGYAFEPINIAADAGNANDSDENEEVFIEPAVNRLNNTDWCLCGHCSVATLSSNRECICCFEVESVRRRCGAICITQLPRFTWFCTDSEALVLGLASMSATRANRVNNILARPIHSRLVISN